MRLLLPLLALAIPIPAAAQDPRLQPSPTFAQCLASGDAARGNATAIDLCRGAEQALQERRMADTFKRASDQLGWKGQDALRKDQARWLQDSSARCSALAAADPRSSQMGRLYSQCILDETIARIAWLEDVPPERAP